jgi:hypothetical protein
MVNATKPRRWVSALAVVLVASGVLFAIHTDRARAGDPLADVSSVGVVRFIDPPDLTICFCGPFSLIGEKEDVVVHRVSNEIDLSQYIGEKVSVTGKPFRTPCQGTLLRVCDFINVTKLETAPLPTESDTWGRIKSLYNK